MNKLDELDRLAEAIRERRPLVLFLGQHAWTDASRNDLVLKAALTRAGRYTPETAQRGFPALLDRVPLAADFYEWLADAYDRQPMADWFESIASLPLNAVFTTSISPAIGRDFRTGGREVEAVLSKEDSPGAPRHRRRLHITYLFGRAGERLSHEMPPLSTPELRTRTALHATSLLARAVDTTTPLGVLLVDGYEPGKDWLSQEALAGVLSAFQPGQVYWFGWDKTSGNLEPSLLRELAAPDGPVVFVRERLHVALQALELANRIDLSVPARTLAEDTVTIGDGLLQLSSATRLKTSTGAAILDDTWLAPLSPLGPEATYGDFRRFHGFADEPRRLVDGIRRGFAIHRTFEKELFEKAVFALTNVGKVQEPLLIHGQSGSGKSVGLARLAYEIRSAKKYPVLFAARASRVPGVDELDEFCLRAEDAGAPATLLVCDANATASRYRDLVRGFFSRGRRVVVVGSAYRIVDSNDADSDSQQRNLIEVPADLDGAELEHLGEVLSKFVGTSPTLTASPYLLPAIYRVLPDVRPRLASGLAKEARDAEEHLRVRGSEIAGVPKPVGAVGEAMLKAGLADARTLLEDRIEEFLGTMTDAASRAIDFVMVPGKLDCPVPINLLMRAVGAGESLTEIAQLFAGIDLFRWSTNGEDDVFIQPRLRLEAQLIAARRLGTAQAEAEIAIRLLTNANPSSFGSCERRFVLDLVHHLGPDGPYGQRYSHSYLGVARALTDIRTKRGVLDPSFMLQEATLRRRVFRDAPSVDDVNSATILEEAREIVDLALEEYGASKSRGLRRMTANLKVERAAIYGFRAVQRLKQGADIEEVWQFYLAARDSARSAVYTADTYFATDISLWVPNDLLRDADWDAGRRAELVADIWDALERVDADQLDPDQREQFEKRRVKVAQTLDDKRLEEEALQALESAGSRAGFFLRARDIGGALLGTGNANEAEVQRASVAADFLEAHEAKIEDDARCLRYLLRCRWLTRTGTYLFGGERAPLPADERHIRRLLTLVERLRVVEGSLGDPRTVYLQAVLLWRLSREHDARELWRELSRETEYSDPRRIVRQHVWSEADGRPRLFQGRIIGDEPGRGRYRVLVEEIRQEVELLQRDFRDIELRRGAAVAGGFHIAFNYIGPVAERPSRRGGR